MGRTPKEVDAGSFGLRPFNSPSALTSSKPIRARPKPACGHPGTAGRRISASERIERERPENPAERVKGASEHSQHQRQDGERR